MKCALYLYALFAIIIGYKTVNCSIYPTKPVSETVYYVGSTDAVIWKDSHQGPHLNEIPLCDIVLYYENKDCVGTLAKQVPAMNRTQNVYFDPNWNYTAGTNYTIRFICNSLIFYTANFKISADDSESPDNAGAIPVSFIDSGTTQVTLISSPTPSPASTVNASATQDGQSGETGLNKLSNAARRRIDHELLWIGWPVAVGISLAL